MYIQSLHIDHIKAFETLQLDFARPVSNRYEGLNVFVGGNSSGKSTLLKCIAMALSGPTVANQQLITAAGWIRRHAAKATVELMVLWNQDYDQVRNSGKNPPSDGFAVGLTFEAEETSTLLKAKRYETPKRSLIRSAERGPWNPEASGWCLCAYGPLRRLTGSSTEALRYALGRGKLASCVTLFREDAALSESETWLKQEYARTLEQKSQERPESPLVEQVRQFLNNGLLPDGFEITTVSIDHVYVTTPNGGELPMRDLSDGFRSAFALILDIIHNMAVSYGDRNLFSVDHNGQVFVNKPGVILIDELEAHLHPSWQRVICEWLKTRFPNVQFFITTHSPLIAQAADEGGLFVLPLPDEIVSGQTVRRLQPHEQERVRLGRAEKVLLGQAFGLQRTWSLQAQKLVERWEMLTRQRHANGGLSAAEQNEYEALKTQVAIVFDDNPDEVFNA